MKTKLLQQNKPRRTQGSERIADLAVLPVFLNLKGKHVVLAGGSDAAAWKGELLAASGAHIHLYAEELDDAFDVVCSAHPDAFTHHNRPWGADIFNNMQIAIGDCESDGEAQAFYCAAKAAGIPVNVIDKPKYCEFQFGSIVNRSPAIVSISTAGAAPILGQAIRRKIETLLPKHLQGWAQLASDIRSKVNESLPMGRLRRAFWERFVDRAFNEASDHRSHNQVLQDILNVENHEGGKKGRVTLVGAGPGDAELLTLKAVRALQAADVILFDDLVSSDVLELARREAKRMLVGKRGGKVSCKQEDINNMMVSFAKAGKNVVRLKSGDPVIFGRAGEEISRLRSDNIAVSIVPGITSASAMAASFGISLTHRDHAQSVRFITGHSRKGVLPNDVDWSAVADPTTTTVFYMGGRTATEIKARLLFKGMSANTPVVVASSVSREDQKNWIGTLDNLDVGIDTIGFDNPVLIGVGLAFGAVALQDVCADKMIQSNIA